MTPTAQFSLIVYNIFCMWLTATLLMLAYSFRSNQQEFNIKCWVTTNLNRFAVGAIMLIGIGVLMVISPDFESILGVLGFNADKSPIALGMAIAALLIGGVPGNSAKQSKPELQ